MNTSYDLNSTPKSLNRSKYVESLMDFSTPMSTISNPCQSIKSIHDINSTILNKLLEKFHEHKIHFNNTENYLYLFDNHLREITIILNQLQNSLDSNSLLKQPTDQLETRLLKMSTKREQIRTVINNYHQSPIINQTLEDIIQQISPLITKQIKRSDPLIHDIELIKAVKLSLNQKTNLIERIHDEENEINHRINDYHIKLQHRQELLMKLIDKIIEQQKLNEKSLEKLHFHKPHFDQHTKQLMEFNQLNEEYQFLQEENRQLKEKTKENIKKLYQFINQNSE